MIRLRFPLLQLAVFALCYVATQTSDAQSINFGSGSNAFTIEFVPIGNPGNADDTSGSPSIAGKVDYLYSMGKFEVSRDMITKANAEGGLGITLDDMSSFGGNGVDRPATGVSWNESARFVNWLNTSTGGTPAYKFTTSTSSANIELWTAGEAGFDASNPFRNSLATYFLPSMDEWYKAAYFNPSTGIYGDYPSSDGLDPIAVASGTVDKTAVFGQLTAMGPADITQAGGLSAYGVMGMGGNVYEWEETTFDLMNSSGSSARCERGGFWLEDSSYLSSSNRLSSGPHGKGVGTGFRVASLNSAAVVGDANGDGNFDFGDIEAFFVALTDPNAYAVLYSNVSISLLDMNQDDNTDFGDIDAFFTALTGR